MKKNVIYESILEKISNNSYIKRYIILTIGLFISAVCYNLFILPLDIVTGGTSGIATIFNYLFEIDPSLTIFLLSFLLFIICYCSLGQDDTIAMGFITVVYPLFIKATSGVDQIFLISQDSVLLLAIFIGLISGISNGLMLKTGLNTGGFSIISKTIAKKRKSSVTKVNFIINVIIVIIGGFIFGINKVLYAIIILYISKIVSDKILLGISKNKTFYIISKKYQEIEDVLLEELHHDVTIFNTKGKFLDERQKAIMVVIPTSESIILKEIIKELDSNAFIIVSDSYEVNGQDVKVRSVNYKKRGLFSRLFLKKMI